MPIYQGTAKNRLISFTENDAPKKITDMFKGAIEQAAKAINPLFTGLSSIGARDSFVGEGLQNEPAFHTNDNTVVNLKKSQKRAQLVQRPKTTIIIKKKQFDSLRNNYDMTYLDDQERLYLSAVKCLMRRKCDEIALYESLIDINSISESDGFLSVEQLLNSSIGGIANLVSLGLAGALGLSNLSNSIFGSVLDSSEPTAPENKVLGFLTDLYNLKSRNDRSKGSNYTRWVEDETIANTSGLGPGVGTIELNLASRITTRVGIGSSDGGASISIQDPYNLTVITDTDIEIAVRSAINQEAGLLGLMTGSPSLKINTARALDLILTELLSARKLPPVQFSFLDEEVQVEFGQQTFSGRISTADGQSLGFTAKETALVNSIVSQLRDYSASLKTISTVFDVISSDYKPLRDRMRNDFLGHNIIQPMDTVTIFAASNTKDITPANTLLSSASLTTFLSNGVDDITDRISDQFIEQERLDIAPSIPFLVYKTLRNPDIYRDDGSCVFSGPVGTVSGSYSASSGEFTYDVSVDSNTKYLEISRYTETVDLASTFNSVEDPITPFNLDGMVDPVTGLFKASGEGLRLTDENIRKLPYLRANKGPRAGNTISQESDLNVDAGSKLTAQHVPGLTYQWKKGIVAATLKTGGSDEIKGRTPDTARLNSGAGGISAIKNPFAGLDPANIASILLTGQPYSYSSFLKSLKNSTNAGFSFDSKNSSRQFFSYLFDSIGRTSKYYGNFVPAKESAVDRNTVIATYEAINRISALNDSLSSESFKKQIFANAQAIGSADIASAELARTSIEEKINSIGSSVSTIRQALPSNVKVMLEGAEESVVFAEDESNNLNYLKYKVRRKPEDARYNRDNNYFLVASKYDSDVSIQASVLEQIGLNADLFRAEYKTPLDTILSACNALQLEFFADNNGNIILKPPTYNKIPLSLFMLLQQNAASSGVDVMPSFVNGLIQSKKSITLELIYKNELEISQLIARSGKTPELQKIEFLKKKTNDEAEDFYAPSLDSQLIIKIKDLFDDLNSMGDSFSSGERARINLKSISKSASELIGQQDWLSLIMTEKARLDGINVYDQQEIQKIKADTKEQLDLPQTQYISRLFADLSAISAGITKRRNLVRSLKDALSKTTSSSSTSLETALYGLNSLVSPAGAANYPIADLIKSNPLLDDIVVDDINNNEGPRSSKRFIINDDVILSLNLSHRAPSFTQVSVTGAIPLVAPTGGTIGKIPILQARATDFDMWRQYGARGRQTIHRPDMSNADTQLAPYAVLSLISERRKIHTMSITVVGNEYYAPGDTVYVNNRSMLYYVEQVNHDFDLTRGSFSTTLSLTHGRALGDFIPTPTDVLGRQLLSFSSQAAVRNVSRTNINSGNEGITNLGSVFVSSYSSMLPGFSSDVRGDDATQSLNAKVMSFVEDNSLLIQSTVLRAATRYSSFDSKSNKSERVEVRAYYASSVLNSKALATSLAAAVAERVKTQQNSQEGFISVLDLNVEVHVVDIEQDLSDDNKKYLRFPSEEAWKSPVQITPKFDLGNTQQKKMVSLPLNAIDIAYVSETIAAGTA